MKHEEYLKVIKVIADAFTVLENAMPENNLEKQQVLNKWTETGMWFRMYHDVTKSVEGVEVKLKSNLKD